MIKFNSQKGLPANGLSHRRWQAGLAPIVIVLIVLVLAGITSSYFFIFRHYFNAIAIIDKCIEKVKDTEELIFYIPSDISIQKIEQLKEKALVLMGVESIGFISADENLKKLKERYKLDDVTILKGLEGLGKNPLDHQLKVSITEAVTPEELIDGFKDIASNVRLAFTTVDVIHTENQKARLKEQKKQLNDELKRFNIPYIVRFSSMIGETKQCE